MENNQFTCNCHLANLVEFLKKKFANDKIIDSPKCFEPLTLKNRPLISLNQKELVCTGKCFFNAIKKFIGNPENVCAENGNYCPEGCVCADSIVRCTNQNLKQFPLGIPTDITELYLNNNNILEIPLNILQNFTKLIKL